MSLCRHSRLIISTAFVACFFLFPYNVLSGSRITDSLNKALITVKADSDKVKILIAISENTDCADTTNKLKFANDALLLSEKIKWYKGLCGANLTIGKMYDCQHNYRSAFKYYEQAKSLAIISDDQLSQATAIQFIAYTHNLLTHYSVALDNYREVLALKPDPKIEIGVLGNMGDIYMKIGDCTVALVCYDSSLKLQDALIRTSKENNIHDTLQKAGLLITIGDIYLTMSEYDKALENYSNAKYLISLTNAKPVENYALISIGKAYQCKKEPAKAIEYYMLAFKGSKDLMDVGAETSILNLLGNVYLETGEISNAMKFAQKALTLAQENTDYEQLPLIYTTLGKIYTAQKNYNQAVTYLHNAVAICGKNCALVNEKDAWEALSVTYKQMNQPALALDAYERFIAIRDSVYNIQKANELTRMDEETKYGQARIVDSLRQKDAYNLKMQKQQVYTYSGYAGLVLFLLLAFFIYRNYSHEKKANIVISRANEAIKSEKQLSENLLLNILPEEVAKELKLRGSVNAKLYEPVTVLFTDFVNFTSAAERFTPQELVAELDACFKAFDGIMQRYNVEKIKTVGDGYVAVSGLPNPDPVHAGEMIKAAIELRDFMLARKQDLGDHTFEMRIGINSGIVVAGIVGSKKFAYDIWGDTVNIAARMEQYGEPGKVNISDVTYQLVKNEFACTYRGEIDAKHKGKMSMYFVERVIG